MDFTQIILAAINPFFALATVIFGGFMTYLMAKINKKVEETKKVTDAAHALLQREITQQLKISWKLAEKVAKLTNKKEDIDYAHEMKQAFILHLQKNPTIQE